jgi:tetratricopeptide (TPR) repeat protein
VVLLGVALSSVACKPKGTVDPSIAAVTSDAEASAWAVHEALEDRIRSGGASEADRQAALDKVRAAPDDQTAAYAYARASVAGRVAEGRGLKALKILEEMRTWARTSIERDAKFQDMAATRMLGTLLALAGQHLDGGDSEEGLELLESVVEAHPDNPLNHLRLAEAYVALGDPESGFESLCVAVAGRAQLMAEEQRLLDRLVDEVGGAEALSCAGGEGQ